MNNYHQNKSFHKLDKESRSLLVKAEIAKRCIIPDTVNLGKVCATQAVIDIFGKDKILKLIRRHEHKDYGDLDEHDIYANELALICNHRVVSRYHVENEMVYVITEADRSCTTILFSYEY